MYLGSWKIDDLLTFSVTTHRFDTGAATDADSPPTYRVYEDETSTPIITGTMALLDSSNTAGLYSEQITLSAANGLEKGKSYNIYITGAVNSVTGTTSRSFQIEAEVDANVVSGGVNVTQFGGSAGTFSSGIPAVNTTQISGDSTAADNVETAYDDTAGTVPWHGIIDQGTAQAATGTTIRLRSAATFGDDTIIGATVMAFGSDQGYWQVQVITDYVNSTDTATVPGWTVTPSGTITYKVFASAAGTGVAQTGDAYAIVASGSFGNSAIKTALDLKATQASVDDLPTNAELATALASADDAVLSAISALNNLSAAQVNAEVDTALADVGVTTTVTGRIDAAVSTRSSQASVDDLPTNSELSTALAAADDAVLAAIATVDTVVDSILALLDDAQSEPSQGAPAANADVVTKIAYLYQWARNKKTNNGTENAYYADNGSTINQKQTTSEAAGTVEVGEMTTGA